MARSKASTVGPGIVYLGGPEAGVSVRGAKRPTSCDGFLTISDSDLYQEIKIYICGWVLVLFPAKLGPKTPFNGPSSKNGAERT